MTYPQRATESDDAGDGQLAKMLAFVEAMVAQDGFKPKQLGVDMTKDVGIGRLHAPASCSNPQRDVLMGIAAIGCRPADRRLPARLPDPG